VSAAAAVHSGGSVTPVAVTSRRGRRLARIGLRRLGWARELALVALLYGLYTAARAVIGVPVAQAESRGRDILHLEGLAGLDIEGPFNAFLTSVPPLGLLAAYLYATLHYVVTPAVLGWLALRSRTEYRIERNGLLIATALGLVGYWLLPTAPPRLVDGSLTDTLAHFSSFGWWGEAASAPRGLEGLSDQYAALPSLHVGWAVWVALVLHRHAGRRLVRRWVWIYPVVMTLVVVSTANHYLLDAVAGAAVALAGVALARRFARPSIIHREGVPDEHPRATAPITNRHARGNAGLDPRRAAPGRARGRDLASHLRLADRGGRGRQPAGRVRPGRAGVAPARSEPGHLFQQRFLVGADDQRLSAPALKLRARTERRIRRRIHHRVRLARRRCPGCRSGRHAEPPGRDGHPARPECGHVRGHRGYRRVRRSFDHARRCEPGVDLDASAPGPQLGGWTTRGPLSAAVPSPGEDWAPPQSQRATARPATAMDGTPRSPGPFVPPVLRASVPPRRRPAGRDCAHPGRRTSWRTRTLAGRRCTT
jgi:hypothetical protein